VEQRDDDGRHELRLPEKGRNLNRRSAYAISGRPPRRKIELTALLAEPPVPALHPQMAEVFRNKAATLADGLEYDDKRDKARLELRGFVDRIVIPPEGLLEVVGNLGTMLCAAQGQRTSATAVGKIGCGGSQPLIPTALYIVAA
jgi:hypothetical protein